MSDSQEKLDHAAAEVNAWMAENQTLGSEGGVCDFCANVLVAGDHTTFVADTILGAMGTDDGASLALGWDPYWAACSNCAPVVRERDPEKLAVHALANRNQMRVTISPENLPVVLADLVALYTEFFARFNGEEARLAEVKP